MLNRIAAISKSLLAKINSKGNKTRVLYIDADCLSPNIVAILRDLSRDFNKMVLIKTVGLPEQERYRNTYQKLLPMAEIILVNKVGKEASDKVLAMHLVKTVLTDNVSHLNIVTRDADFIDVLNYAKQIAKFESAIVFMNEKCHHIRKAVAKKCRENDCVFISINVDKTSNNFRDVDDTQHFDMAKLNDIKRIIDTHSDSDRTMALVKFRWHLQDAKILNQDVTWPTILQVLKREKLVLKSRKSYLQFYTP